MKATSLLIFIYIIGLLSANRTINPDEIIGIWWNEERTSRVEVFKQNNKYHGKIVFLKVNTNPDGTTPRTDYNNENEALQSRELLGLTIMKNLAWDADENDWEDGEVYDPKSGSTYSCYVKMQEDGKLYLKGYVMGMPFLGRSTLWTRHIVK